MFNFLPVVLFASALFLPSELHIVTCFVLVFFYILLPSRCQMPPYYRYFKVISFLYIALAFASLAINLILMHADVSYLKSILYPFFVLAPIFLLVICCLLTSFGASVFYIFFF